jgi:hypothetical protein
MVLPYGAHLQILFIIMPFSGCLVNRKSAEIHTLQCGDPFAVKKEEGGVPSSFSDAAFLHYFAVLTATTSRPLYIPQALQARCGKRGAPQFGHATTPGTSSFQTLLRLLSRLALDTLHLGTAMMTPP